MSTGAIRRLKERLDIPAAGQNFVEAGIRMRISIYKDDLSAGRGADKAVRNFVAALSVRGHEVFLFDKGDLVTAVNRPCDIFVVTGTNELVDIDEMFPARFPWPTVLQLHTHPRAIFKRTWFKFRKWRRNVAIRRAFQRLNAVQVLMPEYVDILRHVLKSNCPDKIVAIGNFLPEHRHEAVIRRERVIVYPAAIHLALKRQELLVKAFARIASEFPSWQVHLYGKGRAKDERKLLALIDRLGLGNQVLFKGYGKLDDAYAQCSFMAFTSALEGFPLTVLEAASFGKTTISCTPHMSGLIEDGVTGLLVQPTSDALATAMQKLMTHPAYASELGLAAQRWLQTSFSSENVMATWDHLLSDVCREMPK